VFGTAFLVTPALAADDIIPLDIATAMASPDAKANLDGSIKFYFGKTAHPAVITSLGETSANRKANGFGRKSTKGCERAFANAMIAMQQHARKLGGNAIININNYFKKVETPIDRTIECRSGLWMDGVALKGEVVKIAQ
jgi:uncharacterized protein YbjQ (UPF0145 family)